MSEEAARRADAPEETEPGKVLSVRFGRSANCSSVGSVVDVLFVSSVVGTALLGALAVLLRSGGEQAPADRVDGPPEGDDGADPPREG